MCCDKCGDILQARTYDYGRCSETGYHDAGEYLYCDTCRQSVDEGDALEEGPEAERLRERRESEIESSQYAAWLIERARHHKITPEEHGAQARSFAYGNVHLSNGSVTRDDIERAFELLESAGGGRENHIILWPDECSVAPSTVSPTTTDEAKK